MPEVDLAPEVVEDSHRDGGGIDSLYRPCRDDAAVEGIVQHDLELSSVHLEAPFRCPGTFGPCVSFRKMLAPASDDAARRGPGLSEREATSRHWARRRLAMSLISQHASKR